MTTFYFPAYKCSLCEQKFNDGLCYVGLADALNHVPELKNMNRFTTASMEILVSESLQGLKGLIKMTDVWTKVGKFLGRAIALTLILCAWAIIIAFTLKVLWFIWFRILL